MPATTEVESIAIKQSDTSIDWFTEEIADSERPMPVSARSERVGDLNYLKTVAEAIEMMRYGNSGGGNPRWEVVECQSVYPYLSDGTPNS